MWVQGGYLYVLGSYMVGWVTGKSDLWVGQAGGKVRWVGR